MKAKLTLQQEAFCLAYMEEKGNASEAYRRAYNTSKMKPESVHRLAKELMDNVKIASRIEELKQPMLKKHRVTVDSLIEELDEARRVAMASEKSVSAAVSATMGKAKIMGLIIDKQRQVDKNDNDVKEMTEQQLEEYVKRLFENPDIAAIFKRLGTTGACEENK